MESVGGSANAQGWRGVALKGIPLVLGLAVIGFFYFYHLGAPTLWADEADTGVFAKNILLYGYPYCFDGRNLTFYEGGIVGSKKLINALVSWLPFYVGALSLKIFGKSEIGLRALFVGFGMLSLLPLYAILKDRYSKPLLLSVVFLLSPQVLLFQRNARYYPILIFSYVLLLYYLSTEYRSKTKDFFVGAVCFTVIFHTHQFSAITAAISFIVYGLICKSLQRNAVKLYACLFGGVTWIVWFCLQGDRFERQAMVSDLLKNDFTGWVILTCNNIKYYLVDLDFVNSLPLILICLLLGVGICRHKKKYIKLLFDDKIQLFIILNLIVHIVLSSATFGCETEYNFSILRYMPHFVLCGYLILARLVRLAVKSNNVACYVVIGALMTNVFTLSYWMHPRDANPPATWWPKVYDEILFTKEDTWKEILSLIRTNKKDSQGQEVITVFPLYLNELLIFYLGDDYLIRPPVEVGSDKEKSIVAVIGERPMRAFQQTPAWVVSFLPFAEYPSQYAELSVPYYRQSPDAMRPELTRHVFFAGDDPQSVYLYH
jgi:hypothetical protein